MTPINQHGQPVGHSLQWAAVTPPPGVVLEGRWCRLEPLDADRHATSLHVANLADTAGVMWTYLSYGPFDSVEDYADWCRRMSAGTDPLFHAVVDSSTNEAIGVASYLRIEPALGVIEVGHIAYSPRLQRTTAATEAMYLMMRHVFEDLGYRRYEWKCDALNQPSRRAAERLGFTFEGIFRQASVYKGRNRDTAWYSVIDADWPRLRDGFEAWLDPTNFDESGAQIHHLRAPDPESS
jgi:RimJ/RimL family protein N-acetyltransferase